MFNTVVVFRENKLSYGLSLASFSLQLAIAFIFIHFKKSRFVADLLFYTENEVIALPKIEIQ